MKLISWNVNGIRAATRNGLMQWMERNPAEVICVQEVKAFQEQIEPEYRSPFGYYSYWHSAEKAGYSGVALFTQKEPLDVQYGMGKKEFDQEGRVIVAEYRDFFLINAYFPNSQREGARLPYKLKFCDEILKLCNRLVKKGKNIILCGDYNIAHQEIDLKNPKANIKNAGFLPEEREWMTHFLSVGYVDTFRHFEKGPGFYTWWSYRPGVREKNIGWRLDYHCVNQGLMDRVKASRIFSEVMGSDHCPVEIELRS